MPRKIHVLSYDGPSISMWLIASKSTVLHVGSLRGGGGAAAPTLQKWTLFMFQYANKKTLQLSPHIEYLKDILPLTPIRRLEK